ncbi:MAG: NADH-quinone oxidoreductase subunit N [Cytophagaceae bacterium]
MDIQPEILSSRLEDILQSIPLFGPELWLSFGFLILILSGLIAGKRHRVGLIVCVIILLGNFAFLFQQWSEVQMREMGLFLNMLDLRAMSVFLKFVFTITALLVVVFSALSGFYNQVKEIRYEFFLLLIASLIGLNLMVMSANLLMLYISLELVSISSYVLVSILLDLKGSEAGVKYFIYGVFASALMLYGISLIYGFSGSMYFSEEMFSSLASANGWLGYTALGLFLCGLFFKVSIFPFHIWVPDVYEGAPLPVTAWLSIAPKVAGIIVLGIVFSFVVPAYQVEWKTTLAILAMITMAVGNFAALRQTNVKRLLAYSSIAHAGFLLAGISTFKALGFSSVVFYSCVYVLMNSGAFFMVEILSAATGSEDVSKYKGLGYKLPFAGLIFVVLMVALTGLPPTGGFTAKLLLFTSIWDAYRQEGQGVMLFLLVFGLLNTMLALYYYLKIPYIMYFKKAEEEMSKKAGAGSMAFMVLVTLPVLMLFFKPDWLMNYIEKINLYFR